MSRVSEIVIHAHDPSTGPGTRWWAESEAGFVGGSDNLNDLSKAAMEWAQEEGIEPRFRFEDPTIDAHAPEEPPPAASVDDLRPAPQNSYGPASLTQQRDMVSTGASGPRPAPLMGVPLPPTPAGQRHLEKTVVVPA